MRLQAGVCCELERVAPVGDVWCDAAVAGAVRLQGYFYPKQSTPTSWHNSTI
jgi:hypothetical protein